MGRLFPDEVLEPGYTGPAVNVLALILKAMGMDRGNPIPLDGHYGPEMVEAVSCLQNYFNQLPRQKKKLRTDGTLYFATQLAIKRHVGINLQELHTQMFGAPSSIPHSLLTLGGLPKFS